MKIRPTNALLSLIVILLCFLSWTAVLRPVPAPTLALEIPSADGVPAPLSPLTNGCGNAVLDNRMPQKESELTERGCPKRDGEVEMKIYVELGGESAPALMDLDDTSYTSYIRYAFACQPKLSDILRRKASRRQFTLFSQCGWTEDGRVLNDLVWRDRERGYTADPWERKGWPANLELETVDFSDWARLAFLKSDKLVVRSLLKNPVPVIRKMAQDGTLCLVDELHIADTGRMEEGERKEMCEMAEAVRWLARGTGCVTKVIGVSCATATA